MQATSVSKCSGMAKRLQNASAMADFTCLQTRAKSACGVSSCLRRSFLLQKAYSKGTRHGVRATLTIHAYADLATECLLTCWDSPSPHLSWRNANLAILIERGKWKVKRFDDFSPQNGLVRKANKQNQTA